MDKKWQLFECLRRQVQQFVSWTTEHHGFNRADFGGEVEKWGHCHSDLLSRASDSKSWNFNIQRPVKSPISIFWTLNRTSWNQKITTNYTNFIKVL